MDEIRHEFIQVELRSRNVSEVVKSFNSVLGGVIYVILFIILLYE